MYKNALEILFWINIFWSIWPSSSNYYNPSSHQNGKRFGELTQMALTQIQRSDASQACSAAAGGQTSPARHHAQKVPCECLLIRSANKQVIIRLRGPTTHQHPKVFPPSLTPKVVLKVVFYYTEEYAGGF